MRFAYPFATKDTVAPVLGIRGDEDFVFPKLKELGYSAIEMLVRDPDCLDISSLGTKLRHHGLELAAIGTGPAVSDDKLTFTSADDAVRGEAVNRAKRMVELASLFGCPVLIGKMRGDIDDVQPGQSWDRMTAAIELLCGHAAKHDVNVALEPQNTKVINNLNTAQEAIDYMKKINSPNLLLMLDVYHMHVQEGSVTEGFRLAKGKLSYVHLADSNRQAPGKGELDFAEIVRTLHEMQYSGYVSFEISQGTDSCHEAKSAIDHLSSI